MKNILLTGFVPFGGENINPSQLVAESIKLNKLDSVLILPVVYKQAFNIVKSELSRNKYHAVVMLGQAAERPKVSLERFATNWCDSSYPDENGKIILEKEIIKNSAMAYRVKLPLRKWLKEAESKNIPVVISNSAGAYVCNELSYQVLHWIQLRTRLKKVKSIFVHLPLLPEQTVNSNKPNLSFEEMKKSVEFIINKIRLEK